MRDRKIHVHTAQHKRTHTHTHHIHTRHIDTESDLTYKTRLRVFDNYFQSGSKVLYRIALSLLDRCTEQLLETKYEEQFLEVLRFVSFFFLSLVFFSFSLFFLFSFLFSFFLCVLCFVFCFVSCLVLCSPPFFCLLNPFLLQSFLFRPR